MSVSLNQEEFKLCLPKQFHGNVNKDVMKRINDIMADQDTAEMMRDNILGYLDVMNSGKFKLTSYLDAVKYVSFKLMGNSNIVAYVKTFPDKYNTWVKNGMTKKEMSSHVAAYNKNKLVNLIMEQSLVPTYVLNADVYQEAINVQKKLMMDETISPKVRSDAANSILNHLKRPEPAKVELSVAHQETETLAELRELNRQIAMNQSKLINDGTYSPKEIAEYKIINGTCTEVIEEVKPDEQD